MEVALAKAVDKRPPVALGHVHLPVKNVSETRSFLEEIGLRAVFENEKQTFAVMELRGGTHVIIEKSRKRIKPGDRAPVDFMVDDIKVARAKYAKMGMKPSRITSGSVHSSFYIPGPDGWSYKVTSSHTGGRPV